ncbi:hypothetical protein SELMODRAFT_444455 [Selaginella moellendorffii]|uniref:Uncharacterized protein n=1 Tax=Selaginella moellendorffii TaxID=88036 RepID=D8SAQ2_SELML|nr:hypothetical protein SELMODRAFT_444455 [Selaginella moellendorffii]
MALRDLVTGAGGCVVPGEGASSSSNPLANFASSLLGSLPKAQERVRELPTIPTFQGPGQQLEYGSSSAASLPGTEFQNETQHSEFMRGFRDAEPAPYADAWNEATQRGEDLSRFSEFERIYGQKPGGNVQQLHYMDGPPQHALSGFLRSFFASSRTELPFHAVRLPELGLSGFDKQRIRDRSSIMARHFFADKGEEYVNAQVNAFLESLDIEDGVREVREPSNRAFSEMENYWGNTNHGKHEEWVQDFHQQYPQKNYWAEEFQSQHDADGWAAQFSEVQQQSLPARHADFRNVSSLEQTQSLVDTLSKNEDPKFQNSKFLHFVSRMSRGELIVEDNQVKENAVPNAWAQEFTQVNHPGNWAAEFTAGEHANANSWADEFAQQEPGGAWAEEFSNRTQKWADEFQEQVDDGAFVSEDWQESYDKFVEEQLRGEQSRSASSKWTYVFADQNPYVGHPNPLKEGQELFRKGLLSEAVLALEAEVIKNPENAEGWRLLGITHAENDDDRQAIASMVRARDADPTNLEVLLALGVSHTNELEQPEALRYLRGWLQHHPKYGILVPQENAESLTQSDVARLFNEAAAMAPEDGDVHTVLGVLYNLSREYSNAIQSFETALKLKPRDYSLWNKLGATQANSARSSDAIYAYQEALNLKPNYVRAWSNMGIGYANQAQYQESIRYYVRALCMNPKADNAWQYLRMSLSATRTDLLDACDKRDLETLQAEFPL